MPPSSKADKAKLPPPAVLVLETLQRLALNGGQKDEQLQAIVHHWSGKLGSLEHRTKKDEESRRYHTLKHVHRLLQLWLDYKQALITEQMPTVLDSETDQMFVDQVMEYTAIFHDAIYNGAAKDNEKKSAELFREYARSMRQVISEEVEEAVVMLIMATVKHELPHGSVIAMLPTERSQQLMPAFCRMFLDLDLEVLGWPSEEYFAEFAMLIREEHRKYTGDLEFAMKRIEFLRHLLDRSHRSQLYLTEFMHKEYEQRAHQNMKDEIQMLQKAANAAALKNDEA